jgi:hypothetical protein
VDEWLIDYLYGELGAEDQSALEVHLAGCEDCRAKVKDFRRITQAAAALPDPEPSRMVIGRILAEARDQAQQKASFWNGGWIKALATLGLAGVVGGLVLYQYQMGLTPDARLTPPVDERARLERVAPSVRPEEPVRPAPPAAATEPGGSATSPAVSSDASKSVVPMESPAVSPLAAPPAPAPPAPMAESAPPALMSESAPSITPPVAAEAPSASMAQLGAPAEAPTFRSLTDDESSPEVPADVGIGTSSGYRIAGTMLMVEPDDSPVPVVDGKEASGQDTVRIAGTKLWVELEALPAGSPAKDHPMIAAGPKDLDASSTPDGTAPAPKTKANADRPEASMVARCAQPPAKTSPAPETLEPPAPAGTTARTRPKTSSGAAAKADRPVSSEMTASARGTSGKRQAVKEAAPSEEAKGRVAEEPLTADRAETMALWNEGRQAMNDGELDQASHRFNQALQELPPGHRDRPRMLLWLARAYEERGLKDKAVDAYRTLAKESPAHADFVQHKLQQLLVE